MSPGEDSSQCWRGRAQAAVLGHQPSSVSPLFLSIVWILAALYPLSTCLCQAALFMSISSLPSLPVAFTTSAPVPCRPHPAPAVNSSCPGHSATHRAGTRALGWSQEFGVQVLGFAVDLGQCRGALDTRFSSGDIPGRHPGSHAHCTLPWASSMSLWASVISPAKWR